MRIGAGRACLHVTAAPPALLLRMAPRTHRACAHLLRLALHCVSHAQGVGAVASRRAAELYGLHILDEDIQDAKDNVTRFIKLAR